MSELAEKYRERIETLSPISSLSAAYRQQLAQQSEILRFKKRELVFRQGERDELAYYLLDGKLELLADEQLIKEVEGGTAAAVHALAQLQPRQMSAKAKTPVVVLRVNRGLLDRLLSVESQPQSILVEEAGGNADQEEGDWLGRLLQSELFNRVPPSNIQQLLNSLEPLTAQAGEAIIRQGDPGDYYYVLQSGRAEVIRQGSGQGTEIKLAELGPGENFGEEALIADSRRNATVRMVTAGELLRLTKEDFVNLIKKPVLHGISAEHAAELVAAGSASYLDVRQPSEYAENGLAEALNLPLNRLRSEVGKLAPDQRYIACCDTGGRSSTAAFLLTERGFDAYFISGGCTGPAGPPAQAAEAAGERAAAAGAGTAAQASGEPAGQPAPVDADVQASALTAQLAKANLELEEARRIKAEAQRARQDAERVVAEKMAAERAKIEEQARRAERMLEEAQRLRAQLQSEQQAAEAAARQRRREEEEQIERMKAEAQARLQAEQQRLEEVYRRNAAELEALQRQRAEAEHKLAADREALRSEAEATAQRLQDAKAKEQALEDRARKMAAAQQARENQLRESAQSALESERRKLEAEFSKTQAQLQQAREERRAAEAARKAASTEAEKIIAEFKKEHEALRAAELAKLEAERRRLQEEAKKVAGAVETARRMQREAEAAKADALRKQGEAAHQGAAASGERGESGTALEDEIARVEQQAVAAAKRLEDAERAQAQVQEQQAATETQLVQSAEGGGALDDTLQAELAEWLAEQEKLQESTIERRRLQEQQAITARIDAQARKAREEAAQHNESLLEELAAQLGSD